MKRHGASRNRLFSGLFAAWTLAACGTDTAPVRSSKAHTTTAEIERPGFCANQDGDPVRDVFCGDTPPDVKSLADLQTLLNISPTSEDPAAPDLGVNMPDNPFAARGPVAVMSHSTSLSGQLVSPINPRVIVMGSQTIMAFERGVQRIELVSTSRRNKILNFYVVSFEQACNAREGGCKPGDLYTERVESDWTSVSVHDGEQLKNTPLDCRTCHQRVDEAPFLLMRELEGPWTHFFITLPPDPNPNGLRLPGVVNSDLMDNFVAAKADEIYAGYDLTTITAVSPFLLQLRVGTHQPLFFDSLRIMNERYPRGAVSSDDADDKQPEPQHSATWEAAYDAFKRGEQLPLPYFEQRATDLDKQAKLTAAYRRYRDGELDADELPDLADIYPDDPALRARMGLQTEPDASAEDALIQACGSCHNDVLDQSISRARFSVDIARLDRAELDAALDRIQRDHAEPGAMPPPESRQLDSGARERLIDYLKRDHDSSEVDPRLAHAAKMGMAGGEVTREALR